MAGAGTARPGGEAAAGRVLFVLFLGVLMGALDIAIVGPALPAIGRTFQVNTRALAWIFTIYVLFNLIGTPLTARLSDLHGRRRLYVANIVTFAAGSLVVALGGSFSWVLAGRAIQGFGAGGIFPVASAVIGDTFPPERRGRALGLLGAVFGLAFLIGPILGGILLPLGWPWLFLINVPLAVVIVGLALRVLPASQDHGRASSSRGDAGTVAATAGEHAGRPEQAAGAGGHGPAQVPGMRDARAPADRRLDLGGLLLLGGGLAALAIGTGNLEADRLVASLASRGGWPYFLASVILLGLFWRREVRLASPLIDPDVLRNRQLRIANLLALVAGTVEAALVFVPSLLVAAFQVSPAAASFLLLPAVLAMAAGAPLSGRMLDRHGSRAVVLLGAVLLGLTLAAVRWATGALWLLLADGVLMGLGLSGLIGAPLRYIVLNEATLAHRATAQAVTTLFRNIGRMIAGVLVGALIASHAGTLAGYHLAFGVLAVTVGLGAVTALGLKGRDAERRQAEQGAARSG